ncbi:hypothetical protein Btru_069862 [Bulinus truncatus]|nr:hypothetical protein Btru_069862 [Bulinus truncatus]
MGWCFIVQYIRESDLADLEASKEVSNKEENVGQNATSADEAVADYVLDEYGNAIGMFSGTCEFCGAEIKPFPSLDQQLSEPPESLFCCEDYRDFVEFAMTTANRLEDDVAKRNNKISVTVHRHYGSKEARILAKEKAVQRMHAREIQRRKQEASGLQASYQYSYLPHEDGSETPADLQPAEAEIKKPPKKEIAGPKGGGGEKGAGTGDKSWRGGGGGSVDLESVGGYSTQRHVPVLRAGAAAGSVGGYGGMNSEVARQMKTINYQLSSQRCLEEGWTLRAPSPLNQDDPDNETFVPEPLHPAMIASGNVRGRGIVQKFYPSGSPFLTLLPDGTGNVFYPSGRIAILITSVSLGQNTYVVLDDAVEPQMLAIFEPNGCGTCNFANGKIRLNYDQLGGIELDINGARRRSWSWKDQETHVHAPPFQPIVFGMNYFLGVRFMTQESIALSLTGKKRSCRFNVGARLKLLNSENLPSKVNEYQLYIDERKLRIDTVFNKMSNLLKFPKSPKLESMLPPLSVASRQQKLDKKRQGISTSPKPKKVTKQNRLPPLDHPAVTVSVN